MSRTMASPSPEPVSSGPDPARAGRRAGGARGRAPGRWLARHPGWPLTALLVGYPLWWALGIADFIWIILAIPMAADMAIDQNFPIDVCRPDSPVKHAIETAIQQLREARGKVR